MKTFALMVLGVLAFVVGHVAVTQATTELAPVRAPDMCMVSALNNGLEGNVYTQEVDEPIDGCTMYLCAIVLDVDGSTHEYDVMDCGGAVNDE